MWLRLVPSGCVFVLPGPGGRLVTHVFAANGSYIVTATATDKDGGTGPAGTASVAVSFINAASLQQQLAAGGGIVTVETATQQQFADTIKAVNDLPAQSSPVTVVVDLASGNYTD